MRLWVAGAVIGGISAAIAGAQSGGPCIQDGQEFYAPGNAPDCSYSALVVPAPFAVGLWHIISYDICNGKDTQTGSANITDTELAVFLKGFCPNGILSLPPATPSPRTAASKSLPATGQAAQAIVLGDFNGDGIPDAAFVANNAAVIQLGTASGLGATTQQFALPFATSPGSNQILAADFNGDGKLDLAVNDPGDFASNPGGIAILLGNGDGTFGAAKEYAAGAGPIAIAVADFNGDAKMDIAAAGTSITILPGNGDGTFGTAATFPNSLFNVQAMVAVDLNGDGLPDLALAGEGAATLLNTGGGKFGAAQVTQLPDQFAPYLAFADLNHDGHQDLVLPSTLSNALVVLAGKGDGTFQPPASYAVGNNPGSIGVVPLDDGNTILLTPDSISGGTLLTPVSPTGAVGAPAFTPVGGKPAAVAAADFNGDGQPDAAIAAGSSDVTVALSKNGQFAVTAGYSLGKPSPQPESIAAGDLNGDGRPDLIVGTGAGTVATLLGNGDGTFQTPASAAVNQNAGSLALADLNGDGKLDVAVAAFGTLPGFFFADAGGVNVLLGKGDGTFQTPLLLTVNGLQPQSIAAGDLNGDGIPDLAVVMLPAKELMPGAATLAVFLGEGGGKFQAARTFPLQATGLNTGGGIAIGDLNGDGKPDIAATSSFGQQIDILLGDGTGNFKETPAIPSSATTFAYGLTLTDLNRDGKLDLVIPHCCGTTEATFFPGNGDGTFGAEQPLPSGASTSGVAATLFGGNPGLVFVETGAANQGKLTALDFTPAAVTPPAPAIQADVSAASTTISTLAPSSIATAYGANLAASTAPAGAGALPLSLGGASVSVTDSAGVERPAGLFYASPVQVNYYVPDGTATGTATVTISTGSVQGSATVQVANVSPGIFQLNAGGLAAADVIAVAPGGAQTFENVYQLNAAGAVTALPIDLSAGQVYLAVYCTGLRNAKTVTATIGNAGVPVLSAGAQGQYAGLDQVNIGPLPASLTGQVNIVLTADGKASNTVNVVVQ
ncbi:MAG TPA: FG-GAP-like repeat-containing protein [Bryobacteraceae bacterium]|nr:FG-GAP-like repeat-containing protein [Bryobacteraceae bacterium]